MRRKISETEPAAAYTPPRPSKAKRERGWEQKQRDTVGVVTFRGIPPELNDEMKAVAGEMGVTVGELARAFLEYGLEAYKSGDLVLHPEPTRKKFTLFPTEGE